MAKKDCERGQKGDKGDPGELPMVRAWSEDDVSYLGDVVTCEGGTWQARKDTSKKPPHRDWVPLALPGRDAVSPTIRGTYREGETYGHLEVVALNGSSFIARHDDPGLCPGEGWQLIASAGRAGSQGQRESAVSAACQVRQGRKSCAGRSIPSAIAQRL
jgi:hypothetical protein